MLRYPLFCDLQGKTCLVVGAGKLPPINAGHCYRPGRMSPSLPAGSTEISPLWREIRILR